MRILIEEHQYPAEVVEKIILGLTNLRNIKGKVSVNHVGYYYNPALNDGKGDMVFILPKVLLEDVNGEELLFGKYHLNANFPLKRIKKSKCQISKRTK